LLLEWRDALPEIALALLFLITWLKGDIGGVSWARSLLLVMLAEMLLLAAGFVLWQMDIETGMLRGLMWGLLIVYALAAWGLCRLFSSWWPLVALALLLASRWWTDALPMLAGTMDHDERLLAMRGVAMLAAVAVTTVLPLPHLGMTPEVARDLDLPGEGIWVDHPERLFAAGLAYFLAVAVMRIVVQVPG
jgi:hypothetical protein